MATILRHRWPCDHPSSTVSNGVQSERRTEGVPPLIGSLEEGEELAAKVIVTSGHPTTRLVHPLPKAMKEDKENTKPKRGEHRAGGEEEGEKLERVKEKREILSKVVIRRLPPSLTKEQLEEHLQPLPDHDYFEFFASDSR
ncbi:hypothetical protein FKM82_023069 [Ascaphus truei]